TGRQPSAAPAPAAACRGVQRPVPGGGVAGPARRAPGAATAAGMTRHPEAGCSILGGPCRVACPGAACPGVWPGPLGYPALALVATACSHDAHGRSDASTWDPEGGE